MPQTLSELLEQAAKDGIDLADDKAIEAARNALAKHFNPVYTAINNLAFGAAQAKLSQQVTDAEAVRKTAEERATRAEGDLRTALDKAPDVKTLNEQWEAKERDLKATHKKERDQLNERIRNSLLARDQATLESALVDKFDVPRAMAKVLARDSNLLPARSDYDDNGSLSIRQAGQQIPFVPGSGQTHLDLLAEEVAGTVDKDLLISRGDRGSGVSGGGSPGKGDAGFYDGIRKQAREAQKAEQPRVSLDERIRNR